MESFQLWILFDFYILLGDKTNPTSQDKCDIYKKVLKQKYSYKDVYIKTSILYLKFTCEYAYITKRIMPYIQNRRIVLFFLFFIHVFIMYFKSKTHKLEIIFKTYKNLTWFYLNKYKSLSKTILKHLLKYQTFRKISPFINGI